MALPKSIEDMQMLENPIQLRVMPELNIIVGLDDRVVPSALIRVWQDTPQPIIFNGRWAIEITLSQGRLRNLLGEDATSLNRVFRRAEKEGMAHIMIKSNKVIQQIADDIRHAKQEKTSLAIYLQGKVLELLSLGVTNPIHNIDIVLATRIHEILMAEPLNPPSMTELSKQIGASARKMNESFRVIFNMTVFEWLVDWRLKFAKTQLQDHSQSIKGIAKSLGYGNVSNFTNAFCKHFGAPPARMRANLQAGFNT
jgi:AraC-like DNA-binding protein